jgi:hypothetical protein
MVLKGFYAGKSGRIFCGKLSAAGSSALFRACFSQTGVAEGVSCRAVFLIVYLFSLDQFPVFKAQFCNYPAALIVYSSNAILFAIVVAALFRQIAVFTVYPGQAVLMAVRVVCLGE